MKGLNRLLRPDDTRLHGCTEAQCSCGFQGRSLLQRQTRGDKRLHQSALPWRYQNRAPCGCVLLLNPRASHGGASPEPRNRPQSPAKASASPPVTLPPRVRASPLAAAHGRDGCARSPTPLARTNEGHSRAMLARFFSPRKSVQLSRGCPAPSRAGAWSGVPAKKKRQKTAFRE